MKKLFLIGLLLALLGPGLLSASSPYQSGAVNQRIGDEEVEPKDPMMAIVFSILPGIVFHGSGNLYAGDYENGTRMLVMEIFGLGLWAWGHNVIHHSGNWSPYFGPDTNMAGYWITAGGVGLVVASWIWDVATAADAAEAWNRENQFRFQLDSYNGAGARLALATRF